MITLSSNLFFLAVIVLIVPGYVLFSIIHHRSKDFRQLKDVFSRDNTDFLKGLCAVVIMLHHFTCSIKYDSFRLVYSVYINAGYLAVAVFFLISGYCLMLQFAEKGWGYLNGFLRKRVLRLYIPFALCTLFVGILQNSAPQRILWNILTFSFFIDPSGTPNATWFVIAIIVFSIGFYISAKYKNGRYIVQGVFLSSALWIVLCLMIGVGTWWYNTAWSFPLGVWLCQQRKKVYKWVCDHYRMVVIELVALFCGTYLVMAVWRSQVLLQMICSSAFALLTWVLCMRVNLNGAIGKWFGGFTLELFLVHSAILKTFYGFGITNAGWSILLVLFTSVIAGNWMNHLSKWIIRKVLQ